MPAAERALAFQRPPATSRVKAMASAQALTKKSWMWPRMLWPCPGCNSRMGNTASA
jgi:hypothetical protein